MNVLLKVHNDENLLMLKSSEMEAFCVQLSLLREACVDFVVQLPAEVAYLMLEYVDDESFSSAAKISRQWANVCRGSKKARY